MVFVYRLFEKNSFEREGRASFFSRVLLLGVFFGCGNLGVFFVELGFFY